MPTYAYRGDKSFIDHIAKRLEEAGFSREGEPEIADVVLTYCTNMTQLEDLYFGEESLVEAMVAGSVAIDLSPSTPNFANEINAMCTINDIAFISAPMVVKNQVASDAFTKSNLSCFAAGEDGAIQKASVILDAIFGDVQEVGSAGVAQLAKASNTLQKVAEVVSAIEGSTLFKAARTSVSSIDIKSFTPEATSPEAFFVLQAIQEERFDGDFTIEMLMAELSAAIMAADDYEVIIPQAEAAFHLLELLAMIGGAYKSPAALWLVYGEASEEKYEKAGLDWSRAQAYFSEDHEHEDSDPFDDMPMYDDIDMYADDESSLFGYSSN